MLKLYKITVLLSLGTILFLYNNCGNIFSTSSPLVLTGNIYGGEEVLSVEAFSRSVYPITRARCATCHSSQQPIHASSDLEAAHDSIISGFKIDFSNISASRMVKKLREDKHNCWGDCESNAQEMEAAIDVWNSAIKHTGNPTESPTTAFMTKESDYLVYEFSNSPNGLRNNTINLYAETSMINPPMIKVTEAQDSYIYVPNGSNTTLTSNDPAAGLAYFNFNIRTNGTYRIWALVEAPNTNDNGVYFNIKTKAGASVGMVREWEIPVTAGFEWKMLADQTFSLRTGEHSLEVRQRKDGTKIKRIVITSDNGLNETNVGENTAVTLNYDLTGLLNVPNLRLSIDIQDYDLYSYKLSNPRIVTPEGTNIRVKNLKLYINNSYNPQHSTYALVNKLVTSAAPNISNVAMVAIKSSGLNGDKVSFSFDELRVDTGVEDDENGPVIDPAKSLASFQTTVYPISRNSCVSCHDNQSPAHAHDDPENAHDVVLSQNLVNFATPANSRLVQKVRGGHNCGNEAACMTIADNFQAAITEWKTQREAP